MALLQANTEGGPVEGLPAGNQSITVFKGIPFAAPPTGALRWRVPQPVRPWTGVRKCWQFAPIAMQERFASEGGGIAAQDFYVRNFETSEDCLALNIWTPAESADEKLPVAVYIHGGGHTTGYSYLNCYDGEGFAKRGIIMVTIPYRLNVFGYLAHPLLREEEGGVSGNFGIRDQIAALAWIRRNIAAFGGDPDCISIFGQSGGASSVQYLCSTPRAQGLFRRAVMQSGGGLRAPYNMWSESLEMAEKLGTAFFEYARFADLAAARACPADRLLALYAGFCTQKLDEREQPGLMKKGSYMRFTPCVDSDIFPESPVSYCLHGRHPELSYMLGSTAGEGRGTTIANMAWAENELLLHRSPSYLYYFTYVPPGADRAHHSVEHHYVFQTLLRSHRRYGGFDFELSNELADAWAAFFRTGNPNPQGSSAWQPYTQANRKVWEIGSTRQMAAAPLSGEEWTEVGKLLKPGN